MTQHAHCLRSYLPMPHTQYTNTGIGEAEDGEEGNGEVEKENRTE